MEHAGLRRDRAPLARACGILAIVWLGVFAPQVFLRQTCVKGDARAYRPFAEFSRARWHTSHQRTFWNPYVLTGVSASASLADMRPQYLPDLALDLFERLRPGRWVPMAGPIVAHLAGMCAMAALAWGLWTLPTVALVWAGLAWGLSPLLLVPLAFGHTAYFVAVSLLPPILLAVHALIAAPARRAAIGAGLALAALAGLQALNGHPQVVAYSGAVVLAFAVERALRLRRPGRLVGVVLALAGGAAIATAVWLPAMRYGEHSVRAAFGLPLAQVRGMSIAWREIVAFALPGAVGGAEATYWGGLGTTDYPRFFGTTVVLLAGLGLLRGAGAWRDGRALLAILVVVAAALALGPRLAPLYAVVSRMPVFQRFRVASMALVVAVPAMALLSAAGLARAIAGDGRRGAAGVPRGWWLIPGGLLMIGLLLWLPAGSEAYAALARALRPDFAPDLARSAARGAALDCLLRSLLVAAGLLTLGAWPRLRWAPGLAIALLVLDLGVTSLPPLHHASGSESTFTSRPEPALARYGRRDPRSRVLSARGEDVSGWQISGRTRWPEMETNDWIRWGVHAYGGEHGTPPAYWEEFRFLPSFEAMRAMGVAYISSEPDVPQDSTRLELLERAAGEDVYRLRGALSRAYAVPRVAALDHEAAVVTRMLADDFRADQVAYTLDRDLAGEYPGSVGARIAWEMDEPDQLALRVTAPGPAFLVVADAWWPGWSADLDGAAVPIHRVNHSLRGLAIPAGEHALRMRFVPEGWRTGVAVTRGAMLLWLVATLAWCALVTRAPRPRVRARQRPGE